MPYVGFQNEPRNWRADWDAAGIVLSILATFAIGFAVYLGLTI
jgi:hypothetical protein